MTPPVLFLIFNRPDLTAASFAAIRAAKPRQLFIAADGPRPDRIGEEALCDQARHVATQVDWSCDVKTLFRQQNLGCRRAVSSAISWFFEQTEEGIILEDDCMPDSSFFPYCHDLLCRYRDEPRVMCITGNNFQNGKRRGTASYYFSIYNHCWGWASWRRAWVANEDTMTQWNELRSSDFLREMMSKHAARYWQHAFDSVQNGTVDTWDYVWTFACWRHQGLTATPNVNLVTNIGFDERATHTFDPSSHHHRIPAESMRFPLKHPRRIRQHRAADREAEKTVLGLCPPPSLMRRIAGKIARTMNTRALSS